MNLKRPQHSMESHAVSSVCTKTTTRARALASSKSLTSSCSSSTFVPMASVPRTVEIMWDGHTTPGFTLKRKRTGAILVSTVTHKTQLKVGSQLKLVGGFPVTRLTLQDIKTVMLMAPKPVSLVFVTADDVVLGNGVHDMYELPVVSMATKSLEPRANSAPMFYSEPSETNKSKKRKISKLQVALGRVNQLVNRPVRQAGLHVAVGKSIVV